MENDMETKKLYKSKTYGGLAIVAAVMLFRIFGQEEAAQTIDAMGKEGGAEALTQIVELIGVLIAAWGRASAKTKIDV